VTGLPLLSVLRAPKRKLDVRLLGAAYEADINEIAHIYGPCFYTYYTLLYAKAAAAITEHNILGGIYFSWIFISMHCLHGGSQSVSTISAVLACFNINFEIVAIFR
jgi:hypothetical protein